MVPEGDEPVQFAAPSPPWSAFTGEWRAVYDACRAGAYVDCDYVLTNVAEGGLLQTVLWARGQAMKVTFRQVAAPDAGTPAQAGGPALIEGVRAAPRQDVPETPPATEAAFTFRHQESVAAESAISNATRPVCSTQSCEAVIEADATTPSMRVLSMIGAVFPNGYAAPELAFRLPPPP